MTARSYEIRDPIHGFITLSQKEVNLINTRAFQRLRRIRQLAMAFLVYPGTMHTRFDHSIGVMHIAGRICDKLKQRSEITNEDCERVRLAALLHDIGHGPFSHVSEHLLDKHANRANGESTPEKKKIHERVTVDIVENDEEICDILSDEERQFVVDMIQGTPTRDFRRDIVSSDLDADKMDYLLRDSYFAGVKYGIFDLEKIIESFRVHHKGIESDLVISDEGIHALEQLLLAKHHMTQQVYHHRVRSISDAMIIRGIGIAIREGNQELKKLYQYNKTREFINNYMEYHDERLIDSLRRCSQEKARNMFDRIYERRLFKMIGELSLNNIKNPRDNMRIHQADGEQIRKWEEKIAEDFKIDPYEVIVKKLHIRNPNYGSQSYSFHPEAILIFDEMQSDLRKLSDYEIIIARLSSDIPDLVNIQVYVSTEGWDRQHQELQLQDILVNL